MSCKDKGRALTCRVAGPSLLCAAMMLLIPFDTFFPRSSTQSLAQCSHPDGRSTTHGQEIKPLAAYYQCHKRPRAVAEVLRRFRLHYPDAPVLMVNDHGDTSLSAYAEEFGATYEYLERRQSVIEASYYFGTGDDCMAWVKRLGRAAHMADFVILLEDDTHIHKPIRLNTIHYDINSNLIGRLPDKLVNTIDRLGGPWVGDSRSYNGYGGSVYRGSFLRSLSADPRLANWTTELSNCLLEEEGIAADRYMTSLAHLWGGTIGPYPGYCQRVSDWDCNSRIEKDDVEVVHQVYDFYDEPKKDSDPKNAV